MTPSTRVIRSRPERDDFPPRFLLIPQLYVKVLLCSGGKRKEKRRKMGDTEWHVREPNPNNPVVFFDVTIGGADAGRIKMELFADICPKTGEARSDRVR